MKIAVAAMGSTVAGHFGHCENFIFFDTTDGKITAENSVPNPGHRPRLQLKILCLIRGTVRDFCRTFWRITARRLLLPEVWAAAPSIFLMSAVLK